MKRSALAAVALLLALAGCSGAPAPAATKAAPKPSTSRPAAAPAAHEVEFIVTGPKGADYAWVGYSIRRADGSPVAAMKSKIVAVPFAKRLPISGAGETFTLTGLGAGPGLGCAIGFDGVMSSDEGRADNDMGKRPAVACITTR